jgi:glycosyltransferase involved in cell wall biosynthesis
MKILLIANTDWYLYNFRRALANMLRERGFEVGLVSPFGEYTSRLTELGFPWNAWEVGRKTISPIDEFMALSQLTQLYKREKPDIVHHFTIKPVIYGSWAARLAGVPRVINSITGRGYVFLADRWKARLLRPPTRAFYHIALALPNCRVIFENEEDKDYFIQQKLLRPEIASVIAGVGVDTERYFPAPEPEGVPCIVFPARMLWDKGIGVLVEAARLLRERTKARFILVGKPDHGNPTSVKESTLQKWVLEGLVEYWGWQTDMKPVYQNCHIVALPSMYEGTPTALLEAAACGKPLVTSNIAGCRTVVNDGVNGFLIPVNNASALAEALEKLIMDPALRQRMGAAGRKLVEEQFTSASVNQRTLEIYESIKSV